MDGTLIGRIWDPEAQGPAVVTVRGGRVIDITDRAAPLCPRHLRDGRPGGYVRAAPGRDLGPLDALMAAPVGDLSVPHLLAPCDLQAIKACGVTFAGSMVERVIEERAAGDPARAEAIRARVGAAIGDSLRNIRARFARGDGGEGGADRRRAVEPVSRGRDRPGCRGVLQGAGRCPRSGHGATVGLHPISKWNNPEPEIVLAVIVAGPDRRRDAWQ